MKKLTNSLLAAAAIIASVSTVSADESSSKTGFYLGGNVGGANTNVQYSFTNAGSAQTPTGPGTYVAGQIVGSGALANYVQAAKADGGKFNPLFGLFAGYGMQSGSLYFGGEIYGGFDSAKVMPYDDTASGNGSVTGTGTGSAEIPVYGKASVKRTNFYGIAPRLGFLVTPSTLLYVKLGIEGGKWKATVNPGGFAFVGGQINGVGPVYPGDNGTAKVPYTGSKSSISFAPGIGLDAFITKNLFVRAEYSYLFGPKITVKQNTYFNESWSGDSATHTFKITQQSFKVGVGYKF